MARQNQKPSGGGVLDDEIPTIVDDKPRQRPIDDDEPTIDGSADPVAMMQKLGRPSSGMRPAAPRPSADSSGGFSVKNVPVPMLPARPAQPASGVVARPSAPTGDRMQETLEAPQSAFDIPVRPPVPQTGSNESTQYLISAVAPHPLRRAPQRPEPQQAAPRPEPLPPTLDEVLPRDQHPAHATRAATLPKPPVVLFVFAALATLLVIGAVIYALTR